ncbi:hypothetical protein N0V93_006388 [Gnomoniopsis smithogilvyi]|uniref:Secreted protein n=1 Tax=Gnomoniopsis smithogilvyi TaxID=1191159 RepID=A0A9W9CVJ7_9PEZI|nr:hypothetical protein N0V93_006388 [Gnomoniopsis smithogilvyi]
MNKPLAAWALSSTVCRAVLSVEVVYEPNLHIPRKGSYYVQQPYRPTLSRGKGRGATATTSENSHIHNVREGGAKEVGFDPKDITPPAFRFRHLGTTH